MPGSVTLEAIGFLLTLVKINVVVWSKWFQYNFGYLDIALSQLTILHGQFLKG